MTPVPAITGRDEPWPLFHFWYHYLWPELTLAILNFCKRKKSFHAIMMPRSEWSAQWSLKYTQKNDQKFEWKTQRKTSYDYTWLLLVNIAQLDHAFSEFFELKASSIGGQTLKQKDRRRKRKGEKKSIIKT